MLAQPVERRTLRRQDRVEIHLAHRKPCLAQQPREPQRTRMDGVVDRDRAVADHAPGVRERLTRGIGGVRGMGKPQRVLEGGNAPADLAFVEACGQVQMPAPEPLRKIVPARPRGGIGRDAD